MVKEDIRNKKIVLEWIKKKYIPGVIYNEKDEVRPMETAALSAAYQVFLRQPEREGPALLLYLRA